MRVDQEVRKRDKHQHEWTPKEAVARGTTRRIRISQSFVHSNGTANNCSMPTKKHTSSKEGASRARRNLISVLNTLVSPCGHMASGMRRAFPCVAFTPMALWPQISQAQKVASGETRLLHRSTAPSGPEKRRSSRPIQPGQHHNKLGSVWSTDVQLHKTLDESLKPWNWFLV